MYVGIDENHPFSATESSIRFVHFATPSRSTGAAGRFLPCHHPGTQRPVIDENKCSVLPFKNKTKITLRVCVRLSQHVQPVLHLSCSVLKH